VDQLANLGRNLNVPKQLDLDIRHILSYTRQELMDRERNEMQSVFKIKEIHYVGKKDALNRVAWFKKIKYKN